MIRTNRFRLVSGFRNAVPASGRSLPQFSPLLRRHRRIGLLAVVWEAMHGDISGWFEVRVDGPKPGGGRCLLSWPDSTSHLGRLLLLRITRPYGH